MYTRVVVLESRLGRKSDSSPSRDSTWTRLDGIVIMTRLDLDLSQNDFDSTLTCILMTRLSTSHLAYSNQAQLRLSQAHHVHATNVKNYHVDGVGMYLCLEIINLLDTRCYFRPSVPSGFDRNSYTHRSNSHTGRDGT